MVSVKFRTYFSIQHLKSAYLLSDESKKTEEKDYSKIEGLERVELISRNMAFVTGSLFATASFIEATIREIICDIIEGQPRITYLSLDDRRTIESEWNKKGRDNLERRSTINKYKSVLKLIKQNCLNENSTLFMNVSSVIDVRNTLVHYTPEDYSIHSPFLSENHDQYELTEFLDGKFEYSTFYKKSGNPFFPDKCLGYGFSKWALINAVSFVDDFHNSVGLKPIYDHVRKDIEF